MFDTADVEAAPDLDDNWRIATVGAVETKNRTVDTSNLSDTGPSLCWPANTAFVVLKYIGASLKSVLSE